MALLMPFSNIREDISGGGRKYQIILGKRTTHSCRNSVVRIAWETLGTLKECWYGWNTEPRGKIAMAQSAEFHRDQLTQHCVADVVFRSLSQIQGGKQHVFLSKEFVLKTSMVAVQRMEVEKGKQCVINIYSHRTRSKKISFCYKFQINELNPNSSFLEFSDYF